MAMEINGEPVEVVLEAFNKMTVIGPGSIAAATMDIDLVHLLHLEGRTRAKAHMVEEIAASGMCHLTMPVAAVPDRP